MSLPSRLEIPDEVVEIARTLEAAGHEAWCVGGAVRDALLENPHADYDFTTSARPEQVQRLFRRTAAVGVKHGTVGVVDRDFFLEIAVQCHPSSEPPQGVTYFRNLLVERSFSVLPPV